MEKTSRMMLLLALAGISILLTAQTSHVVLPQDKGSDKIDVSIYPEEMRSAYKVFTSKCSKCHTIARPINTTMSREEWERYVKRMAPRVAYLTDQISAGDQGVFEWIAALG